MLTVLAGDPEAADVPPGSWDEAAGFTTASAAAAARREEDRAACEHLGARPLWLPFWDRDYGLDRPEPAVREELRSALAEAETVLVPGWPLWHEDHLWVAEQALASVLGSARVGAYVEQPYALWGLQPEIALPTAGADDWIRLRASLGDRLAKRRAVEAYVTQLPLLGEDIHRHLGIWEARRGGEHLAMVDRLNPLGAGPNHAPTVRELESGERAP